MVDVAFMAAATSGGLTVNVWTGFDESPGIVLKLSSPGVHGMITGYLERAVKARNN